MAKREYLFEVVRDFTEVIVMRWVSALTGTEDVELGGSGQRVELPRRAGERFIVRGVAERKMYENDPNYRRVY